MSLPDSFTITCGNCSSESEYFDWVSTHSFGSSDLDTRPPDDYRFAMKSMLVKRCRNCNYCYGNIRNISDAGRSTLLTDEYLKQLDNPNFPNAANDFLCKAMILEAEDNLMEAGWSTLHAAWCCDDDKKYLQAKFCRIKSIELFQIAKNIGVSKFENDGEFICLLVDLHRKSENISIAKKLAEHRFKIEDNDLFRKILFFQICLCDKQDLNTYKIEDAENYFNTNYQGIRPVKYIFSDDGGSYSFEKKLMLWNQMISPFNN